MYFCNQNTHRSLLLTIINKLRIQTSHEALFIIIYNFCNLTTSVIKQDNNMML